MSWKIVTTPKHCHFHGDWSNKKNCWYKDGSLLWADKPSLCQESTCPLKPMSEEDIKDLAYQIADGILDLLPDGIYPIEAMADLAEKELIAALT